MTYGKTNIVIVGAGFGGLACALNLAKRFKNNPGVRVTLVDRRDFHLFAPNLYEVATAEEEFTSVKDLKKSVALPIADIIKGKAINFVRGEFMAADQKEKVIILKNRKIFYDFLVLALGSETDYFNIPGAKDFAFPLKTLPDALRVRNQIEFALQSRRQDITKNVFRIAVAGGGYTGVEFAAELADMVKILAWKCQYPPEKIELEIIEAANKVAGGFSGRLSGDAAARLKELGARIRLLSPIVRVSKHYVEIFSGERIAYDVLVWTVGVKGKRLPFKYPVAEDKKGRVKTNGCLQVQEHGNIFVIGDDCCVIDEHGVAARATAQDAIDQGRYVAEILPDILKNQRPRGYACLKHGFIVSLGGKWAIADIGRNYFTGFAGFTARQFANLRYYASLIGWIKAIKFLFFEIKIFGRND